MNWGIGLPVINNAQQGRRGLQTSFRTRVGVLATDPKTLSTPFFPFLLNNSEFLLKFALITHSQTPLSVSALITH